jgi:hypothetical protein
MSVIIDYDDNGDGGGIVVYLDRKNPSAQRYFG